MEEQISNRELLHRFDGVERRLDDLSKAVVALARVEERLASQTATFARIDAEIILINVTLKEQSTHLSFVEKTGAGTNVSLSWLERVIWAAFAGAIAWVMGRLN